jgi:hypothetical protein
VTTPWGQFTHLGRWSPLRPRRWAAPANHAVSSLEAFASKALSPVRKPAWWRAEDHAEGEAGTGTTAAGDPLLWVHGELANPWGRPAC